jgi:N utilization substance protein B
MKTNVWARRRARRALVQAVYGWQMTQADAHEIEAEFLAGDALTKADTGFFHDMLAGVLLDSATLDALLAEVIDRKLEALDKVELAILRLGAFELRERIDVPYRVVISEYVDLTKTFGAQDGYKFVNAALDKLAQSLRSVEAGQ